MLEIIRTSRPSWVVAENVPNVIKMALPTVIPDLEKIGYESVLLLIPALGVGAPHRRRRAWVVSKSLDSNSDGIGLYREKMHEHNQGNLSKLENQQGSLVGQMVSPQVWESIDPRVLGVANGLPDRMDREEKQDRINRIKGLGNAIVPQLAYELLKPIAEMELKGYTVSYVNRKKSSHIGSQEEDGSPDIFM
jgi:DNA (cytosine-5)-methyltransferase 1